MKAGGEFEVQVEPLEPLARGAAGPQLGRLAVRKSFSGDLSATSLGEVLSAGTGVESSAGYVAIERVQGSLHGRTGAFVLQHFGILNRGQQQLIIQVVPDSGSGQLQGLAGHMTIRIEDGQHFYELSYTLP